MREIAFEGVDGVGKSTTIEALKQELAEEGLSVQVAAPFREVAAAYPAVDITAALHDPDKRQEVLDVLAENTRRTETAALKDGVDVLIFDRHWMTAFTEVRYDEGVSVTWKGSKPQTVLLDPDLSQPAAFQDRLIEPSEPWAADLEAVKDYADRYRRLGRMYTTCLLGVYRVDDYTTPEAIAKTINWDLHIRR